MTPLDQRTASSTWALARHSGYSLIELMVSLAVGLVIGFGALAMYANTVTAAKSVDNASRLQESGLYVLTTLNKHLRMAGYVDWLDSSRTLQEMSNDVNSDSYRLAGTSVIDMFGAAAAAQVFDTSTSSYAGVQGVHGCIGKMNLVTGGTGANLSYADFNTLTNNACGAVTDTATANAHGITLAYQVLNKPDGVGAGALGTGLNLAQGLTGDCNGNATSTGSANPKGLAAVNRFYLSNFQIFCKGNGGSTQPLASNVEQLVFRYGIARTTLPTDSNIDPSVYSSDMMTGRLLLASEVTANNAWPLVVSVETCVMIRGDLGSAPEGTTGLSSTPSCLDGVTIDYTDRRMRRVFRSVTALRNQLRTSP